MVVADRVGMMNDLLDICDTFDEDVLVKIKGQLQDKVAECQAGEPLEKKMVAIAEEGLKSVRDSKAKADEAAKKAADAAKLAAAGAAKKTAKKAAKSGSSDSDDESSSDDSQDSDSDDGGAAVPWSTLKPFKGVVSGKAVTGETFLLQCTRARSACNNGGLFATAEAKSTDITRTIVEAAAQKKVHELAQDHRDRNALSRWQPKLAGLCEDYLLAAERLE